MSRDPYAVLETSPGVSDAELRAAYRRAVQRHHPDHNGGSPESAQRFEAVQEAYRVIRAERASGPGRGAAASGGSQGSGGSRERPRTPPFTPPGPSTTDPDLEARLAAMESELAAAREAQERARRAAREAAAQTTGGPQASDEQLGYVSTNDSLGKIFADAAAGLSEHLSGARHESEGDSRPGERVTDRMADVFEDIGARLRGERPGRPQQRDRRD